MSAPVIASFNDLAWYQSAERINKEIEDIFFLSSTRQSFSSETQRDLFYEKYLGFYLTHYPEYVWLAWEEKVLGYVLGMPFTKDPSLFALQPHLKSLTPEFNRYPGHLHINCREESRGSGLGSKLVLHFCEQLKLNKIRGVHIITGQNSRNRAFYQRLGFNYEVPAQDPHPMLFMGKEL
jgi:ribosomal protein S18 acetylase RimI-like enzyme